MSTYTPAPFMPNKYRSNFANGTYKRPAYFRGASKVVYFGYVDSEELCQALDKGVADAELGLAITHKRRWTMSEISDALHMHDFPTGHASHGSERADSVAILKGLARLYFETASELEVWLVGEASKRIDLWVLVRRHELGPRLSPAYMLLFPTYSRPLWTCLTVDHSIASAKRLRGRDVAQTPAKAESSERKVFKEDV
ncbi:hypothetical protein P7C70_g4170, partial [Phenoliferia sp. Uapishka_3]